MKKLKSVTKIMMLTGMVLLFLQACEKEEEAQPLMVVNVTTDLGVNLDGAALQTDIPVNASVVVTFDKEIDLSTLSENSIQIRANDSSIPSGLTAVGNVLTIVPNGVLANGTTHTLAISPNLKASDGGSANEASYDFRTYGMANVIPPQSVHQLSYFSFSGNMNDEVGSHTPSATDVRGLTYGRDRHGYEGLAGVFNGTTTIVEIPNAEQYMAHNSMTMSVWIAADSAREGHFVLGLGGWQGFHLELASDWSWIKHTSQFGYADGLSGSSDNVFDGSGAINSNGGYQGWTYHKEVLPLGSVGATYFRGKWAQVVCTYDAATKLYTMYVNGEKAKQSDFNLWPVTDPTKTTSGVKFAGNMDGGNKLALGFIQGSENRIIEHQWADPAEIYTFHFKGLMDDVRIFKVALTEAEVAELYNAEKAM